MGIQIKSGGGAAQLGGGLGSGLSRGVETGLENRREDQLRQQAKDEAQAVTDEMADVIAQDFLSRADEERSKMPEYTPTFQEPVMGPMGIPIPVPGAPGKNPDREDFDGMVDAQVKFIRSLTSRDAIAMASKSAGKLIERHQRDTAKSRLNNSMKAMLKSGFADEGQLSGFVEDIATGKDPIDVYNEFSDWREVELSRRKRTQRGARRIAKFQARAEDKLNSSDDFESGVAERMSLMIEDALIELEGSDEDFDYDSFIQELTDVENALNPEQAAMVKRQVDERNHAQALELEGVKQANRERGQRFTGANKAMEEAIKSGDRTQMQTALKMLKSIELMFEGQPQASGGQAATPQQALPPTVEGADTGSPKRANEIKAYLNAGMGGDWTEGVESADEAYGAANADLDKLLGQLGQAPTGTGEGMQGVAERINQMIDLLDAEKEAGNISEELYMQTINELTTKGERLDSVDGNLKSGKKAKRDEQVENTSVSN